MNIIDILRGHEQEIWR